MCIRDSIYSGRVEALGSILSFLENQKERYVVMSDANIAINYDFNALLAAHQASGADVTVAYQKTEIPEGRKNDNYTLTVDADGRVTELLFNDYRPGKQNLDLDIYVMERQTLIKLVKDADVYKRQAFSRTAPLLPLTLSTAPSEGA